MTTDELISRLAGDLRPVAPRAAWRRLAVGICGGMVASTLLMLAWLGPRPDLAAAVATSAFWIKFGYTAAAALCALRATERLARPGCSAAGAGGTGLLIVVAFVFLAAAELAGAEPSARRAMILGGSASVCPWFIVGLALPVLACALWAVRGLAPTQLRVAGAAAGVLSGAAGAFIYSFHCTETAITFLALWYCLGVVAVGVAGYVAGRVALRW
jgi:hypothetical protein